MFTTSPLVSIVMPAFKTQWLKEAIQSALNQTVVDFELLIGDDSLACEVAEIVDSFDDHRIRYIRNAPEDRGFMRNLTHLMQKAQGRYIKFLWDDDTLLPRSLEILLEIFAKTDAKLAFHQRYHVDEHGNILTAHTSIGGQGFLEMTPELFFGYVIKYDYNFLGEPTNFMLETDAFRSCSGPFDINGIENVYYTDLVLFANFLMQGYAIYGSSEVGSTFRVSTQQGIHPTSPIYSAKIFEREFLRRWCAHQGYLSYKQFMFDFSHRLQLFDDLKGRYPEFEELKRVVLALEHSTEYLPDSYMQAISKAYTSLEQRKKASILSKGK